MRRRRGAGRRGSGADSGGHGDRVALRDVETPDDVSDDYSAFLDQIENGIDLDPQLADSIREGKQDPGLAEQFEALASGTWPFAEKHELNDCVPDQG